MCTENGTNVHHANMGDFLKKTNVGQLKETREVAWEADYTRMTTSESRIVLRG